VFIGKKGFESRRPLRKFDPQSGAPIDDRQINGHFVMIVRPGLFLSYCGRRSLAGHKASDGNPDDQGTELDGPDVARKEAFAALVDYVREVEPADSRCLSIEVRDNNSRPLIKVVVTFEVILPR
jgi:hypothetical protein